MDGLDVVGPQPLTLHSHCLSDMAAAHRPNMRILTATTPNLCKKACHSIWCKTTAALRIRGLYAGGGTSAV